MNDYQRALIEDFYTSRTLKGFKYGIITDIYDLINGDYTIEHLRADMDEWCRRNYVKTLEQLKG